MRNGRAILGVIAVAGCGGAAVAPKESLSHHTDRAPREVRVDRPFVVPRVGTIWFRADVVAAGRELLETRDGKLPAVRIEGATRGGGYRFILWMEVETQVGGVMTAELQSWEIVR